MLISNLLSTTASTVKIQCASDRIGSCKCFLRCLITITSCSLQQELSGGSIQTINTIISGILKYTLNYLPVKCTGMVSDHAKRPLDILSDGESCRLLAYLEDSNDLISIGIRLTLFSGFRLGELCALTWADIDLEEQVLHIRHTLQRIQNQNPLPEDSKTVLHIGSPKNKRERSIPLHPQMTPACFLKSIPSFARTARTPVKIE